MLYLNERLLRLEKISCPLCSFCRSENETPIHLFHECIKTNLLWYKLKKFLKTKIDLPVNTRQSAIFGFLNYENNSLSVFFCCCCCCCCFVFVCFVVFFCMYFIAWVSATVRVHVCSPVDTTLWKRLQYTAIRLKHNCNSCYSVCVCLVYALCVYICNYIFWYIYIYVLRLS